MKLILQSVLYCCLLTTVAHCVELEMSPQLKRRLSTWMQSRLRRGLNSRVSAENAQLVRPEDVEDSLIPHSSTDISVRTKRSTKNSVNQSRRPGCSLGTCTVHDLAHRLHQLNNKLKIGSAPIDKISPQGYGRRRRSLLPARKVTLRLEQGTLRPVWRSREDSQVPVWRNRDSQIHQLEAILRRT